MTPKKLDNIKREITRLRRASAKAADLERVAAKLGRKRVKRGKEPMWESMEFPSLYVLSIPRHGGGRDVAIGTKKSILDQLEDDLLAWGESFENEEDEGEDEDEDEDFGEN